MRLRQYAKRLTDNRTMFVGIILLGVAVIITLVYLPIANREVTKDWRPVHRITKTSLTEAQHTVKRYGPFIAIHNSAMDATLYASTYKNVGVTGMSSFRQRAYGIAGLHDILYRKYDPRTFLSGFNPDDYKVIAHGNYTDEVHRNWGQTDYIVVVKKTSDIKEFVYAVDGTTDMFVDTRLLNAEQTKELHQW